MTDQDRDAARQALGLPAHPSRDTLLRRVRLDGDDVAILVETAPGDVYLDAGGRGIEVSPRALAALREGWTAIEPVRYDESPWYAAAGDEPREVRLLAKALAAAREEGRTEAAARLALMIAAARKDGRLAGLAEKSVEVEVERS